MSSRFEFSPVKLVYGGEALGFQAGRTVLAPRVLPGERAEVEEVRRQKGVVHARPLRILEPSRERIDPLCGYFGRCGGCQYQHLSHEAQAEAKTEILRETLRRLGQVRWEGSIPTHSGPPWNYRNQAQWKVGSLQASFRLFGRITRSPSGQIRRRGWRYTDAGWTMASISGTCSRRASSAAPDAPARRGRAAGDGAREARH